MNNTEAVATAVVSDQAKQHNPMSDSHPDISGYQLVERIGLGGYGEVWRAIGPGGFPKAVKILFGQMDGPQAETELKSLNLMRELRHPFLLNVERVEFIDGRLIVVTELADQSLDQRFRQVVGAGGRGIPRDDLLAYLRDVADALDFMSEHHGLQHLDIKPENLLIQGSHAKVGDFGLTKNLGMTNASVVNGFTPLYAPPELFDGQPSSNSDQYSLAIVYQGMLTGIPPFNGRTAAQLTSQHLRSAPDLTPLPVSDRGVVARALSKNPHARFSGCRQFVDELARRRAGSGSTARQRAEETSAANAGLTQTVDPATFGSTPSTPLRPSQPLPPLPATSAPLISRPTLFIAVGGLGSRIVSLLEDKLRNASGGTVPQAMAFLGMDSDRVSLARACRKQDNYESRLERLVISLRSPLEYRKGSVNHLNWLSRRWLFNIPRSGNVEGMRPLGRLTFVDHELRIRETVSRLLKSIVAESAIKSSSQQTGYSFSTEEVDVCLVGSTSGGTASGCLIDLGYLVRRMLDRSGRHSSRITAILLHSTSIGGQRSDAQDANSCSFLKELNHYSLPGTQSPADRHTDSAPGRSSFDATYFVHLGDDLTSSDFERHVDQLSAYLAAWSLSPERRILESWRDVKRSQPDDSGELTLRTVGYATINEQTWNDTTKAAEQLACSTIRRWIGQAHIAANGSAGNSAGSGTASIADVPESPADSSTAADAETSLLQSLGLERSQLLCLVQELMQGETGRRVDAYAADVAQRASRTPAQETNSSAWVQHLAAQISNDAAGNAAAADSVTRIAQTLRHELNSRMQQAFQQIQSRIIHDLDSPQHLNQVQYTLDMLLKQVEMAITICSQQKSEIQQAFAALCSGSAAVVAPAAARSDVSGSGLLRFSQQYCALLVFQTACQCVLHYLASLKDFLEKQRSETLEQVESVLRKMAEQLQQTEEICQGESSAGTGGAAEAEGNDVSHQVLEAFEQYLQSSGQFRLSSLLKETSVESQAVNLTTAATSFMITCGVRLASPSDDCTADGDLLRETFLTDAHPVLSNVGGGRRVLARIPDRLPLDNWRARLQAEFGDCVVIHQAAGSEVRVLCEVEGITIPAVVDSLTHLRPRVIEMAERVHARNDICF